MTAVESEKKALATAMARLALAGFTLRVVDDGPRGIGYRIAGPGGLRTFDSLAEVEGFIERLGRPA